MSFRLYIDKIYLFINRILWMEVIIFHKFVMYYSTNSWPLAGRYMAANTAWFHNISFLSIYLYTLCAYHVTVGSYGWCRCVRAINLMYSTRAAGCESGRRREHNCLKSVYITTHCTDVCAGNGSGNVMEPLEGNTSNTSQPNPMPCIFSEIHFLCKFTEMNAAWVIGEGKMDKTALSNVSWVSWIFSGILISLSILPRVELCTRYDVDFKSRLFLLVRLSDK